MFLLSRLELRVFFGVIVVVAGKKLKCVAFSQQNYCHKFLKDMSHGGGADEGGDVCISLSVWWNW